MKHRNSLPRLAGAGILALAASLAAAQSNPVKVNPAAQSGVAAASGYWTPERLRNAKPVSMRQAQGFNAQAQMQQPLSGAVRFENGRAPSVNVAADPRNRLFEAANERGTQAAQADDGIETQGVGTFGAHYTSSRLVPLSSDTVYPYRTAGKLFFTIPPGSGADDPPGDYVCSAAVIKLRVVLTAGHCTHSGSRGAGGWFTNWKFVPAFRDGAAPFGEWDWQLVTTSATWAGGGGIVPNAADFALIVPFDRGGNRIGAVTGWLGWQSSSLMPNHKTSLGYPVNIDSGQKMHKVNSQSFRAVAPNNVEYGSNMRGGSSGGPWIMNFGVDGTGEAPSSTPRNRVIGVTSYGYVSTDPKVQGSSVLNQEFINLLNGVCATPGNC